jgi:ATP-binding cassette, subfamily B, bacterial
MTGDFTRRVLVTLALEVWTWQRRVLAALVLLVLAKLAAVVVPLMLKRIVDVLSRPETLAALPIALLVSYAAVRFTTTLFGELRDLVFARVAQSTVADFTVRVFAHLHALGARFHTARATGALTRDVERGTAAIGFLIGASLFTILPTIIEIGAVLAIMIAAYGAEFSFLLAATFVLYSVYTGVFIARRAARQRAVNELDSSAHRRLVDSLLNYETIKFYTNEEFETQRLRGIMGGWVEAGVRNQTALTLLHVGQSAIIALGVAGVMLLAGAEVLAGRLTVGDLVLVNAYVIQVCLPLNALGFVVRETSDALTKAEGLLRLLHERPDPEPAETAAIPTDAPAEVRFENVSFGYEPNRQVLWDMSFTIGAGQTVAVIGGSGSGKSTLARLLLRFADPWSGRITIYGRELRELTRAAVRAKVGVVPQDTTLFNDTIAYNIAYGRIGATEAEIVEAARAANVHDFVEALPDGYATMVGERGLKLSGGEKQRIAIARAILKDPPILVLDEATSALDSRSERAIRVSLEKLAEPRTTLVIAHRLSTIVNADEILVLEAGRIVERGRHAQLLERQGLYAQMWSLQRQERELRRSKHRATLAPVNLVSLVTDAIGTVRAEIDAKGLNLYTTLGDVGAVTGDASVLQEVVSDLVEHAVRVSERGDRVEIDLGRAGNEVRLLVSGTHEGKAAQAGPGHANGHRFDPAVLRTALEENHGQLSIAREPSGGTSYIVTLPVRAIAPPAELERQPGPEPSQAGAALAGRRLLIVDDDEDAREALSLLLKMCGAEVEALDSAHAVLDYLRGRPSARWPDLMICDIGLPDETGYNVLRRIRGFEAERHIPLSARMPAIALTGFARPEDRMQALVAGFQVHLTKPALPKELLELVTRLLDGPAEPAH